MHIFVRMSCPVCVSLCVPCVCVHASVWWSPPAWVCRGLIKLPLHVERPFYQLLFRGAAARKRLVKVSATPSVPSVPCKAAAKIDMIYALLYEPLVCSHHFIRVRKGRLFLRPNQVKRTILPWWNNTTLYEDHKNTSVVAIYFSFRSALWGRAVVLSPWQSDSTHTE